MTQRAGSNKEVQAVTLNLKEQRLLEKTLGTLKLEEAYAVKLLALGNRYYSNLTLKYEVAILYSKELNLSAV